MAQRRLSLVLDLDTGSYSGRLTQAGSQLKQFGGTVDNTSSSVRKFSDTFERSGSAMKSPRAALRDYVMILGDMRLALLNVRDLAVGWIGDLLQQSAKVERLTVLMKGLSSQTTEAGKSAEAKQNLSDLFDMARKTGFAVDDLTDSFVKFRSAKLNPKDGSLQALADAVASFGGTSDTMKRASIAIQQMAGKGVVSMEELRQQLGEAVPNAMGLMARSMGKTVAQLSKEVAKGTVAAGPALALMFAEMQRSYAGAGTKLAQTMTGQLSTLRTNVTQMATEFTGLADKDPKNSLFATSLASLQQLNAILISTDGRQMVANLGQGVNTVASYLFSALKVAIDFRNEIGAGFKAIAIGVAMLTAKRFSAWILQGANEAVVAVRTLGLSLSQAGMQMQAYRQVLSGNITNQNAWVIQNNAAARQVQQIKGAIQAEQSLIGNIRAGITARDQEILNINTEIAAIDKLRLARQADQTQMERAAASAVTSAEVKVAALESELARVQANAMTRNNRTVTNDPQMQASRQAVQIAAAEEQAAIDRVATSRAAADRVANDSSLSRAARAQQLRTATRAQEVAEVELTTATNNRVAAESRLVTFERELVAIRNAARTPTAQEISLTERLAVAETELAAAITRESTARTINTRTANDNARAGMSILAAKERQILLSQQNAVAQTAETAATERLTVAEAMNTLGKRAMATASILATGAVKLLQGAVTLALNPVVMIGVALYQAASAAGFFETRADRAAAAADRLRQGIGALSDMQVLAARRKQIADEMEENKDVNPLLGATIHTGDHWYDTGINTGSNSTRAANRAKLKAEDDKLAAQMQQSAPQVALDAANKNWQKLQDSRDRVLNNFSNAYRDQNDHLQTQLDAGDKTAAAKIAANAARMDATRLAFDQKRYDDIKAGRDRALKAGASKEDIAGYNTMLSKAGDQLDQTKASIKGSTDALATSLGTGAKGLDKFGRAAAMADAKVAGIEATLNGGGKALAEFNSKLNSGLFKGMSEDQIGSLRRAATATDALAASRKAAGQEDKFESRLVSMAGRLAQLKDSLTDGGGELAKFNAQLAASPDSLGLKPGQIQQLRDLAQSIDETKHAQDIKKLTDDLAGDFNKAQIEGDQLWSSFTRGTMEADQKLAQLKGRFAEKLVGLTGGDLKSAQEQIDKIVASMQRAEQIQTIQGWKDSAAEIRIALLDENAQREANFQRELQRQRTLLDAINTRTNAEINSTTATQQAKDAAITEQRAANASFLAWKSAAEARDKRASESQLIQQARSWANLGQNIQGTMAQALGSIVEGMTDANENFGTLVTDILKKIMTVILEAMIAYAILSAIGMANNSSGEHVSMGSFLKGQMAGGLSSTGANSASQIGYNNSSQIKNPDLSTLSVPVHHDGGMIGQSRRWTSVASNLFAGAQTRHNGGWIGGRQLKSGEVPLIGLDDEVILNKEQQRAMGKGLIGGTAAAPNVQVNVINNSGTPLETEHGEPQMNGKDMIVNVVVEAAQKQGKLRDLLTTLGK